jgi:hypothetical protein
MNQPGQGKTSMKKTLWARPAAMAVASLLVSAATALLSSCDSGGDGSSPSGTSTVQGYVESFTTDTAYFLPAPRANGIESVIAGLSDLLAPSAYAGLGGVGVHMVGTDLRTTTADDGFFVMSGVPSGRQQMRFSFNGSDAYTDVEVPENSTVTLHDVRCVGSSVSVGHMEMKMHGNGGSAGAMHMGSASGN